MGDGDWQLPGEQRSQAKGQCLMFDSRVMLNQPHHHDLLWQFPHARSSYFLSQLTSGMHPLDLTFSGLISCWWLLLKQYLGLCTGPLLANSWEGAQEPGLHCWLELTDNPSSSGIKGHSSDILWNHATAMIFPELKHPMVFGILVQMPLLGLIKNSACTISTSLWNCPGSGFSGFRVGGVGCVIWINRSTVSPKGSPKKPLVFLPQGLITLNL